MSAGNNPELSNTEEYIELVELAGRKGWSVGGGYDPQTGEVHAAVGTSSWSFHIPDAIDVSQVLPGALGETDLVDVIEEVVGETTETIITFDGKLLPGFRKLVESLIDIEPISRS